MELVCVLDQLVWTSCGQRGQIKLNLASGKQSVCAEWGGGPGFDQNDNFNQSHKYGKYGPKAAPEGAENSISNQKKFQ